MSYIRYNPPRPARFVKVRVGDRIRAVQVPMDMPGRKFIVKQYPSQGQVSKFHNPMDKELKLIRLATKLKDFFSTKPKLHLATLIWLKERGLSTDDPYGIINYLESKGIYDRTIFHEMIEGNYPSIQEPDLSPLTLNPGRYIKGYGSYYMYHHPNGRRDYHPPYYYK